MVNALLTSFSPGTKVSLETEGDGMRLERHYVTVSYKQGKFSEVGAEETMVGPD